MNLSQTGGTSTSGLLSGAYIWPATRGGLDRGRILPTQYQTDNPRSPRSKSAGRTLLQVLQKVLVVSIAVVACRRRAAPLWVGAFRFPREDESVGAKLRSGSCEDHLT